MWIKRRIEFLVPAFLVCALALPFVIAGVIPSFRPHGARGWMLWNARNVYERAGCLP
jgi:hypothetical protein